MRLQIEANVLLLPLKKSIERTLTESSKSTMGERSSLLYFCSLIHFISCDAAADDKKGGKAERKQERKDDAYLLLLRHSSSFIWVLFSTGFVEIFEEDFCCS